MIDKRICDLICFFYVDDQCFNGSDCPMDRYTYEECVEMINKVNINEKQRITKEEFIRDMERIMED